MFILKDNELKKLKSCIFYGRATITRSRKGIYYVPKVADYSSYPTQIIRFKGNRKNVEFSSYSDSTVSKNRST